MTAIEAIVEQLMCDDDLGYCYECSRDKCCEACSGAKVRIRAALEAAVREAVERCARVALRLADSFPPGPRLLAVGVAETIRALGKEGK